MKTRISVLIIGFLMFCESYSNAQLKLGSDGIYIKKGTPFISDGLSLVPSSDLEISNNNLVKKSEAILWPEGSSILRLYQFSNPITFQGKLGLNFQEVELNGNKAEALTLAFSTASSINYKEYSLIEGSLVDFSERSVKHSFVSIPSLSNVTAVTPLNVKGQYAALKANNVITPNGDGVNDFWVIRNIEQYPNNELKIFDRTGRIIYEVIGYNNSWDGTIDGRPLAEDSYYYVLYFDSGRKKITGFISIVKKE